MTNRAAPAPLPPIENVDELIYVRDGRVVISSPSVAKMFDVPHRVVIRDIDLLQRMNPPLTFKSRFRHHAWGVWEMTRLGFQVISEYFSIGRTNSPGPQMLEAFDRAERDYAHKVACGYVLKDLAEPEGEHNAQPQGEHPQGETEGRNHP